MGQFREQQAALREHGTQADLHRGEAMGSVVEENGVTKQEFMHFAQQVHQQAAGANAELQRGLQESAAHHQQGLQRQAEEFGRQMVEERVRNDQRDQLVRQSVAELAKHKTIPQAPIPPTPGMADINNAVKETAQQIRGENAQMFGQFSQGLAQQLGEAVRGMHGAGEQNMQHMLRMLTQEKAERKKQSEETVSSLNPGPKPPPPPPGGTVTSATQGRSPGSSNDDAPMAQAPDIFSNVAPDIFSKFAKSLMHNIKPFITMEEWAKRKKDHPKNFKLHIEGGDGRTKSLRSLFKDENFNKKRLSIEDQNMGFKHKIEQQPDPPPVSGGESSAPEHMHDLGEKKQIKMGKQTKQKAGVKTATDILDEKLKNQRRGVIRKPKQRPVVQGKVVQGKVVQPRVVQGRSVGQLPSQYRGLTRA